MLLAVLSVYGMLNPSSSRYIKPGQALVTQVRSLSMRLQEIDAAIKDGHVIDGYPFPETPVTDRRYRWIQALHKGARYPDVLTRRPGLVEQIVDKEVSVIPEEFRPLFVLSVLWVEGGFSSNGSRAWRC